MEMWVDFKVVKQSVTIEQVLGRYAIKLKQNGKELHGHCPIHQGKGEESFRANTEKNAFQCFACHAKGNVLDFVAAMEQCSIRDAAMKLQEWFGIGSRHDGPVPRGKRMPESSGELAGKERSHANDESINGERTAPNKLLGFQLQGIDYGHAYLNGRGISQETAEHFGVGYFPGKGSMAGRVVIPIHNAAGELVAYAGRAIDATEPRYKLPAGFHKARELYNLHRAIATGQRGFIVVEGFFDAMKVHEAGYPFVVALMGCSMSEQQAELLVSAADMVLLMLDGDDAGRRGTDEIMVRIGRRVWVKSIDLSEAHQPDQMSAEEIQAVLKQ
jgi:DNA primase